MSQTKERHREYMQEHKKERKKRKHKRKSEVLKLCHEIKAKKGCKYCQEKNIVCLIFHHRNGSKKEGTVGTFIARGRSDEVILKEIEKCDIVCANCHMKIHAGQIKEN